MPSKIARFRLLNSIRSWHVLAVAVALLLPSCSGGLSTVRGKVLYDGKPIKNAVVTFHPKSGDNTAMRPTGNTDENGVFTLGTQNATGAPAGEYRVTIRWLDEDPNAPRKLEGIAERPDRLKGRYADPEQSKFIVTIKSGTNELEPFKLDKVD